MAVVFLSGSDLHFLKFIKNWLEIWMIWICIFHVMEYRLMLVSSGFYWWHDRTGYMIGSGMCLRDRFLHSWCEFVSKRRAWDTCHMYLVTKLLLSSKILACMLLLSFCDWFYNSLVQRCSPVIFLFLHSSR